MNVRFLVNGDPVELDVPGMRRLLDVLREDLGLTGTKEGCGEGECGACSVIVDSHLVDACLVPICQVDGHTVRTVEGLGRPAADAAAADAASDEGGSAGAVGSVGAREFDRLDDLQRAFLEAGGAQCGICTPGMLMAARAYLDDGGGPDETAIRTAIAGNLCRCTGYTKIVEAIALAAAFQRSEGGSLPPDGGALPPGPVP